jgi:aryl sulfotransferase
VVYLVRDPRAVAVSWAHHLGTTPEAAVEFMRAPVGAGTGAAPSGWLADVGMYRLGTWSGHVRSWLDQSGLPMVVVRYEDLRREPLRELRRVLDAARLTVDDEALAAAVGASSFETMLIQELVGGFMEAPRPGVPFFRRGESDAWREELSPELIRQVELDHADVMQRLGYQPLARSMSAAPDASTAEDLP